MIHIDLKCVVHFQDSTMFIYSFLQVSKSFSDVLFFAFYLLALVV